MLLELQKQQEKVMARQLHLQQLQQLRNSGEKVEVAKELESCRWG